jgi:hypothetical protein
MEEEEKRRIGKGNQQELSSRGGSNTLLEGLATVEELALETLSNELVPRFS